MRFHFQRKLTMYLYPYSPRRRVKHGRRKIPWIEGAQLQQYDELHWKWCKVLFVLSYIVCMFRGQLRKVLFIYIIFFPFPNALWQILHADWLIIFISSNRALCYSVAINDVNEFSFMYEGFLHFFYNNSKIEKACTF